MATRDLHTMPDAPVRDSCASCASCGALLARDQRYCLACGARRADAPLPFRRALAAPARGEPSSDHIVVSRHAAGSREREAPAGGTPAGLALLAGLACLLIALGVGVLVGRSGAAQDARSPQPQVISVAAPAGAPATTPASPGAGAAAGAEPSRTTPAKGAAKPAANRPRTRNRSGASGAGTKAKSGTVRQLDSATGKDYVKKSQKLPKQVGTGGRPPPRDNRPAGGGTGFQGIG
jgi:hypothetical protein